MVYTVGAVAAAYELYSSVTQVLVLETNIKINIGDINMGNININICDPGHRALQEAPTAQRFFR